MEYSLEAAEAYIGKRVVVSLRDVDSEGEETFSGFWGVIESVQEDGLLLKIEGGREDEYWLMPPDLEAFQPAAHEFYQLSNDDDVVIGVDFEAYWSSSDDPKNL